MIFNDDEVSLLAQVPLVRLSTGRLIDDIVDPRIFWTADPRSWHLCYPMMTQLPLDAFFSAARARGQKFGRGTSFWSSAMKLFPPTLPIKEDGGLAGEATETPTYLERSRVLY